jgi:hypothetical protein
MHEESASEDTWSHYSALRDHFIGMVRPLDESQLGTIVPMCPAWTVKDVAAHVCGLNDDLTSGITEGLGSDQRTAHHVGLRSTTTISEICDEWLGYDSEMSAICEETPLWATRLAADLTVHLHDVQHALGRPIDRNDGFTADAAHRYAVVFQERVRDILGLGVTVELTDGMRRVADPALPPSGVTLRATPFDFLRSFTGRRSRAQVESLDWTGDPTRILDAAWSPYGPFQPDAVVD